MIKTLKTANYTDKMNNADTETPLKSREIKRYTKTFKEWE